MRGVRVLADEVRSRIGAGAAVVLVLVLIVAQALLSVALLASDGVRSASAVKVLAPSGLVVDSSGSASLEGAWPQVAERARRWHGDARLTLVSAQYDWPWTAEESGPDLPVGGWLTFVFMRGTGGDSETLSVLVERRSGAIVREAERAVGISAPSGEVRLDGWAVSSVAAVAAAEAAGGEQFRTACPSARHVTRVGLEGSREGGTTGAYWVVTYQDTRVASAPALRIRVDAITAAVAAETPAAAERELADAEACSG